MRQLQTLVTALIVAGGVVLGAGQANAHASLIGSTPVYGSTVVAAPTTVLLQFDNLVEPGLVKVRLKDGNDVEVGKGTLVGDRSPRASVDFALPAHGEGKYLITWVSFAFDGHIVSGTIPYTVDPNATASSAAPTPASDQGTTGDLGGSANRIIDIVEIQLRFLQYLSLAALIGGALWLLCARQSGVSSDLVRETARTFALGGGYGAAAFALARVGTGAWRFVDGGYDAATILDRVVDGQLGAGIVAAGLFSVAAVAAGRVSLGITASTDSSENVNDVGVVATGRPAGLGQVSAILVLGAVGSMLTAAVGHGTTAPVPGVNAILMGMHLIAAAAWVGGVVVLAYVASEKRFSANNERWAELRGALRYVSQIFLVCAPLLYFTGARAAYVYSDGIPDGRWGVTLAAKVALVAGGSAVGLFHYLRGRDGRGMRGATLGVEAALLVLTLTAAAVLSVTTI